MNYSEKEIKEAKEMIYWYHCNLYSESNLQKPCNMKIEDAFLIFENFLYKESAREQYSF